MRLGNIRPSDILIPFFLCFSIFGAEWDNPEYGQADPDKPVYQKAGWWKFSIERKVRIPSEDDIRKRLEYEFQLAQQKETMKQIRLANRMILWGFLFAVACAVAHGANSLEWLKNLFSYGIGGGVLSVIGGVGYKWFMHNEAAIEWLFGITLFVGVSIWILSHKRVRDWSASSIIARKLKIGDKGDDVSNHVSSSSEVVEALSESADDAD